MPFGVFSTIMGFKENLKSELLYQDMLVKELAAVTGVSKQTLDNYLNVRGRIPAADVAVKIARALGVTVEYLITGEEAPRGQENASPELRNLIQSYKQLSAPDRQLVAAMIQFCREKDKKRL